MRRLGADIRVAGMGDHKHVSAFVYTLMVTQEWLDAL
jgi:hypothetical protein